MDKVHTQGSFYQSIKSQLFCAPSSEKQKTRVIMSQIEKCLPFLPFVRYPHNNFSVLSRETTESFRAYCVSELKSLYGVRGLYPNISKI